uniref:Letm1 RBD domain-containing protein n=1 Tax=Rhodosorus marinus TaxID=101924 RepID=A0A7S3E6R9_9RHOD|mmetsp:Transcript_10566/g.44056  ORF Transcript_10566/g.44056 Transcript_10566/m.44056 type:complete len:276 (+) Transcript_10566:110-937(+)
MEGVASWIFAFLQVNTVRRMLAVTVLQLELERIYLYLRNEVETTSDFMDQQLLIREFGQMDERLSILKVYVDESQVLLVDDDELGELAGDVAFMKSRVGLENDFYTTTFDWPKAKRTLFDGVGKMKEGTEFFFRGLRLLAGDVAYAFRLIRKAAVGFILSPREVRTLRRTGRDLISFIPFSIILLLPLTPIGHVLVFSFIQRFFPDFFPTTFSERRQQLMKRYEQMRKTMDPTIDVEQMHKTSMVGGGKLSAPGLGREGDNSVASHSIDDVHLAE